VLNTDAEPELLEAGVTMSAVQRLAKLAQRARHKVGGMPSVVRRNRPSSLRGGFAQARRCRNGL